MIRLEGVSKEYRSGRGKILALSDVSFTIEKNCKAVVFGKSGSGKTTLLYCIGGLERPERGGIITCFDVGIHSLSEKALSSFQRKNLGFVFQHANLFSCLTVFENIAFPLELNGFKKDDVVNRVSELLENIGLAGAGAALPHELSGGEVQRVSVARAIAHSPRVLLADEPTANLDSDTGRDLVQLMFNMGHDQGCTMIISTHDPDIINLADVRLPIQDGKIESEYK
jgi:ABC-type lipoprotein export system ATPase subunit